MSNINYNNYFELISYLKRLSDPKYLEFNKKIVNTPSNMLGIRTPILRNIAKEISKSDPVDFINILEHNYFEESILEGFVISRFKDMTLFDKYFRLFIPKINNWATCDMCTNSMKQIKNNEKYFHLARELIKSSKEFEIRTGYIIMLSHFLDEEHIDTILNVLNSENPSNYYYVNMAKAWLISVCFVKFRDKTLFFIENNSLDNFTHNKAIQKIIESYRVSPQDKIYLRNKKRHS